MYIKKIIFTILNLYMFASKKILYIYKFIENNPRFTGNFETIRLAKVRKNEIEKTQRIHTQRYQFCLHATSVAAPLIDRKILIS